MPEPQETAAPRPETEPGLRLDATVASATYSNLCRVTGTPEECREKLRLWEGVLDTPLLYAPSVGVAPARVAENNRLIVESFGS